MDEEVFYYDSSTIHIPVDILDELSFEVLPGEPLYIGMLIIVDERDERGKNRYQIEKLPEYEIKTYKKLIKKYNESPWISQWRQRLADLETQNPGR